MSSPRQFRWPWRRRADIAQAVDDELEFHLTARAAELEAEGRSPEMARREAELEFGDLDGTRRYCAQSDWEGERSMRRTEYWSEVRHDLAYTARSLRRRPGFSLAVILPLGLGVGATAAIFALIWSVLVAPLPYQAPNELVAIEQFMPSNPTTTVGSMSPPNYLDVRANVPDLVGVGAYYQSEATLTGVGAPTRVSTPAVTPSLLSTLGVSPALGRTFVEGDGNPGQSRLALLSHGFWVRRFGGDPTVIGRTIRLDGDAYTVIGVMPPRFVFPVSGADLWLPLGWSAAIESERGAQYLGVIGRLRPSVPFSRLDAQLATLSARLQAEHPANQDYLGIRAGSFVELVVGSTRMPLLLLGAASVVLILIAAANVTNLLLAWVNTRSTEFAIRAALGAGRARLGRQVLTDAVTLGILGGLLGAGLAAAGLAGFGRWWPGILPRQETVSLGLVVPAIAFGLSILVGVLIGIGPARQAGRGALADRLRVGRQSQGAGDLRVRRGLVATELGLATVLLTGAVLLVNAIGQLRRVDLGFRPESAISFRAVLPNSGYSTGESITQFYQDLLEQIGRLPGVTSVGATMSLPLAGGSFGGSFTSTTPTELGDATARRAQYRVVTRDYFRAMGIPVLQGRGFDPTDQRGGARVLVVSEGFAKRFWPTTGALGKSLATGVQPGPDGIEGTIVGIVGDVRAGGPHQEPVPTVYALSPQVASAEMTIVVRTAGTTEAVAGAARQLVEARDRDILLDRVMTMPEVVGASLGRPRFVMELLALFAGLAVVLATIGIYGVVSYAVAQRTREIGVRMALGADQGRVMRTVVSQEIRWAVAGLGLGALGAAAVAPLLASAVFGVDPRSVVVQLAAPVGLLGVAVVACLVPARRAARVSPLVAIRGE